MTDVIEKIGESIVQHGKYNNRVYLMKLNKKDIKDNIIDKLNNLAKKNNYTKIFAKIPEWSRNFFLGNEYSEEAYIPRFFDNIDNVYFMCKYYDEERQLNKDKNEIDRVISTALGKKDTKPFDKELENYTLRKLNNNDTEKMADLYKLVFDTYPFPIFDSEYLKKTMEENFIYFGIFDKEKLVAVSSSEIDYDNKNAEMTDFAVLHDYRGKNFASYLLDTMENEMRNLKITTVYTIARALSYGMNITFSKHGYTYTGTLINNTNISGHLESMNVWYKHL